MRRFLGIMPASLFVLAVLVTTMFAITGNWVTDNEHPFVGLAVFYDSKGEFVWRCSGSLLSPTVFLTAGHCTDSTGEAGPGTGAHTARIYFQQDAGAHYDPVTQHDSVSGYPDECAAGTLGILCATSSHVYNFGFADFAGFPNTKDAGLVILDQPIYPGSFGRLARTGTLDALSTQRGREATAFTVSGYGLTLRTAEHSALPNVSYRVRLMAESALVNLINALTDGYNLQTEGNGNGRGGTCSGDSGGPVFLGSSRSNLIVGVTSFGQNSLCRGVDFAFRTDTGAVLDWIRTTVGPQLWAQIAP
jgi:hypothetical protein